MFLTTWRVFSSSSLLPLLTPPSEAILLSMSFSLRRFVFVDVSTVSHLGPYGLKFSRKTLIESDAVPSGAGYLDHVHRVHLLRGILHDCWSSFPHCRSVNDRLEQLSREESQCVPSSVHFITDHRSESFHFTMKQTLLTNAAVRPNILPFFLFVHEEHVHLFPYLPL